ncbi:MAG TPA: hypothetical protein VGO62_17835, partial [Myxococcota bacterium]
DYVELYALGMTLSLVHRYYTLPYVYLDKQIFQAHVTRFTLFFFILNLAAVASVFLFKWKSPQDFFRPVDVATGVAAMALAAQCVFADKAAHLFSIRALIAASVPLLVATVLGCAGFFTSDHAACDLVCAALCVAASALLAWEKRSTLVCTVVAVLALVGAAVCAGAFDISLWHPRIRGSDVVGAVGVVAAVWNVWHTLMQKFGIMRMYAAKSSVPVAKRTPAWVDRFLIFGSLPFLAVWVGPAQRATIAAQPKAITQYLMPVIDGIAVVQPYLLVPTTLVALSSIALFAVCEWRTRIVSWPRVSMAVALTLLNASFLVVSPLKVYIAYGFSHGLEYMVFVWAFLRRRYAQPLAHKPLLQRALAHPVLAYLAFTALIGGVYFLIDFGPRFHIYEGSPKLFGISANTWLFSFAIWQSLGHFYFDGFLWKMRAPSTRASI